MVILMNPDAESASKDSRHANRRILILGSPGSGKSTLSRRIGAVIGQEPIDLDTVAAIAYRTGVRPRPIQPLLSEAERIASLPNWIAEGVFTAWTMPLVNAATDVVVVRTSIARCLGRVIRRHLSRGIRNEHGGIRRLLAFCVEIVDYHRNKDVDAHWPDNPDRTTFATTMRLGSAAGGRLAILSTDQEIEHFVKTLG